MSMDVITSRDNARVRQARAARDGKAPDKIFIEGMRLCEEALQAGLHVEEIFHTVEFMRDERGARLLLELERTGVRLTVVSERVFASLSDTKNPQGIALLAARPQADADILGNALQDATLLVILHRLNNPANAGAILRTAEAAGASGIIATAGTCDIFSAKALRGAMGSSFRLPVWAGADLAEAITWCKERGIRTICADIRAELSHTEVDWTISRALIVGPEASGLSVDEIALADEALRIPMQEPVESLNVAVAAGVILYEAARQRTSHAKAQRRKEKI